MTGSSINKDLILNVIGACRSKKFESMMIEKDFGIQPIKSEKIPFFPRRYLECSRDIFNESVIEFHNNIFYIWTHRNVMCTKKRIN